MNKSLRLSIISLFIIIISLAGLIGPTSVAASRMVSVDKSSSGQQISVVVGDTVKVFLDQNSASTGFIWELGGNSDPSVLEYVGHETQPPAIPQPGTPGKDVWTFSALKTGTSTILLEYSQPWQGGIKNADSFVLTVNVFDEIPSVPASSGIFTGLMIASFVVLMVFVITMRPRCCQSKS